MPLFGKKKAKAEEGQKKEEPKKAQKKGRKAGQKKGKKGAAEKKPSAEIGVEVPEQPPVTSAPDGAAASPRGLGENVASRPGRHQLEQPPGFVLGEGLRG